MSGLADCGRVGVRPGGNVGLRITTAADGDRIAGYSGLSTCGSVWACPVCSAKIAQPRGEELGQVLSWATCQHHTVAMITLTMRHRLGQRLRDCWDAASKGWGRVTSGRRWERIVERFGVLGFARAVEVTHGDNGWHVHIHAVIVFDGPMSELMIRQAGEEMYGSWSAGLASKGFTALRDSGGLDIRASTEATEEWLAEYLVKQLAVEATHGQAKKGRGHGRTPFQIAADFFATGDMADLGVWWEWEKTSKGRRQLTWSQGLRAMAGLSEEEATDEELAEAELGDEDMLQMPPETWRVVRDIDTELLDVAELKGLPGAMRWLQDRGLVYTVVPLPPGYR